MPQRLSHLTKAPERMRRLRWFAFVFLGVLLLSYGAMATAPVSDQVKAMGKRYREVEEQLPRSIRYVKREETAEGTMVKQAWFNGVGDPLKVATERAGAQGREISEFTAIDPDMTYDGLFVFTRRETPATDGGTRVEEARRYYGQVTYPDRFGGQSMNNGVLIRELRKSAHFAAGEPLDTAKTPNTTVAVPKPRDSNPTEEEQKARWELFQKPEKIADELRAAGAPEADPFAGVRGDSDRFRLIHGSASPDGRYAIAIGFDEPVDWSNYADKYLKEEEVYTAESAEDLHNYVVELATMRILGATGGSYFGTRRRYNHRESVVTWSDDSATFVQQYDDKWSYQSCHAGRIGAGQKLVGTVDLGEAVEKYAASFLKRKGRKYEGSIALSVAEVRPDGTIVVEVTGQEASVPRKGDIYFEVEETLRLSEKAGKLQLQLLKTRLLPKD